MSATPWLPGPPTLPGLYWYIVCDRAGHPLYPLSRGLCHGMVFQAPGGKLMVEDVGGAKPVEEFRRRWAGPLLPPEPLEELT